MPVTLLATESQLQQVSNKEAAVENRIFPEDLKTLAGDILVLKTLRDEIVSGRHAFYRAASNARSGASLPDRPPDASNPGTSKVPQSFQSSLLHRVGNIKNSGQAEQTSKSDLYLPEAHQVGQRYMESIVGRAARRSSAKYETDESNFQNRRRGVEGKRVHRSPDPPSTQTHLGVGHSAERRNVSNGSRGYRRSRSPLGRPDDLDYGVHDRGPATTAPYGDKRNLDRHHSRDQPSWKPSTFGRERGRPPRNRSYSPPRRRAASPPAQMPGQSRPSRPVSAVPDSRQSRKSSMAGRDAGRKKPSQNYTVHEADVASSRQNSYSHRLQGAQQDMERKTSADGCACLQSLSSEHVGCFLTEFSTTKSIQAEPRCALSALTLSNKLTHIRKG